jgi:hypothetical protein
MEEDVGKALCSDGLAVHFHAVTGLDERVEPARLTVHAHAARFDQLVRAPPRRDTCACEVRVQPHL